MKINKTLKDSLEAIENYQEKKILDTALFYEPIPSIINAVQDSAFIKKIKTDETSVLMARKKFIKKIWDNGLKYYLMTTKGIHHSMETTDTKVSLSSLDGIIKITLQKINENTSVTFLIFTINSSLLAFPKYLLVEFVPKGMEYFLVHATVKEVRDLVNNFISFVDQNGLSFHPCDKQ